MKLLSKIYFWWRKFCRLFRHRKLRQGVINTNYSFLCNNCVGAMVTHDLGLRFNTPTVNLFFEPISHYISFLKLIESGNDITNLTEVPNTSKSYPVGALNDTIFINFKHYHDFDSAKKKWNERLARLNIDNLLVILIEKDGCTYKDLVDFDKLSFPNKVAIVHKEYPEIQCSYVLKGNRAENEVEDLTKWDGFWGKQRYDTIDWVKLFNEIKL